MLTPNILLEKLHRWRLLSGMALFGVITSELIVSGMSLLLHGQVSDDFMLTGLVTSAIVAPLVLITLNHLLKQLARDQEMQANAAARDKNNLELAIRNAQILIWELDTASGQFRYDEKQFGLLGLESATPPHDVQQWIALVHPEDRTVFIERFQAALQADSPLFDLEYRFSLTPDSQQQSGSWHQSDAWSHSGSWVWLHSKGSVIRRDDSGKPLLAVGTTMNVTTRKVTELKSLDAKKRFELIFNSHPDVMVISRLPKGIITDVNDAFVTNTGYAKQEAIGNTTLGLGFWSDAERRRMTEAIARDGQCRALEFEFTLKNGGKRIGSLSAVASRLEGSPHLISTVHDITTRKQVELDLAEREEQLRTLVEAVPDAIQFKDGAGRWLIANTVCLRLFGLEDQQWRYLTDTEIGQQHPRLAAMMASCRASDEEAWRSRMLFHNEERSQDADGDMRYYDILKVPLFSASGERKALVIVSRDITDKKQSDELIWNQANFDPLTLLPNRRMFRDRLAQDLKKAHRAGLKLGLLFLDLDHFKEVNDTLGHDAGDMLLVDAACRIGACVRDSDTVARLGGDEFTIILAELEDGSSVERIARDIIHSLCQPFHLGNDTVYVSASVGITLCPDDATDLETLIKNADQAMFAAKQAGRNRYSYFTRSLQDEAQHRQQVISDLRIALAENQFRLYYQPIVELATGQVRKAECLLRWQHPKCGIVNPGDFIPLAEDSGLIHEIGAWVFREATRQLDHCRENCDPGFQLSVNVSPVQFHDALQQQKWLDILATNHLKGSSIVIEITEGLLLDTSDIVTKKLLAFRDAGIQVAIDDFGTGYSALSYLNRLDIDYLKIDQAFIRNLAPNSSDMALIEAIIVMAHKLGLKVIAEGVETAEQNALLRAVNCDFVQGYHYSMPLPAEDLRAWLRKRRAAISHPL